MYTPFLKEKKTGLFSSLNFFQGFGFQVSVDVSWQKTDLFFGGVVLFYSVRVSRLFRSVTSLLSFMSLSMKGGRHTMNSLPRMPFCLTCH